MAGMSHGDLPTIDTRQRKPAKPKRSKAGRRALASAGAWVAAVLLLAAAFFLFVIGVGLAQRSAVRMFHNQMIVDAITQYQIVEQGDDLMAKSIHASVVADAFLMSKDSDNYHKWKKLSEEWDAVAKKQIEAETRAQIRRFSR